MQDKEIRRNEKVGKIVFFTMMIILVGFTAPLSFRFIDRILPGNVLFPYFALILFDGGMFSWLYLYVNLALGRAQRDLSYRMTLFSLMGVGLLSIGEIMWEAQDLTQWVWVSYLPSIVTSVLVIWVLVNLWMVLSFQLKDPKIRTATLMNEINSQIFDESLIAVDKKRKHIAGKLVHMMSDVMVDSLTREITNQYGEDSDQYEYELIKQKKEVEIVPEIVEEVDRGVRAIEESDQEW